MPFCFVHGQSGFLNAALGKTVLIDWNVLEFTFFKKNPGVPQSDMIIDQIQPSGDKKKHNVSGSALKFNHRLCTLFNGCFTF